jgi:Ca2+-binding EF-hand superfamily protein
MKLQRRVCPLLASVSWLCLCLYLCLCLCLPHQAHATGPSGKAGPGKSAPGKAAPGAPPRDGKTMDLAVRAMFRDCDADVSGELDLPEMSSCIRKQAPAEIIDKIEPVYYFRTFDVNKNGLLGFDEFSAAVRPSDNVEYEVHTRDGTKKTYTQEELSEKTLESTKDIRMEDGKLVKDDEGTNSIDELMESNPAMARVILIGNFARDLLNHSGTIPGHMHGLNTLARGGEGAEEGGVPPSAEEFADYLPHNKYFDVSNE